MHAPPDITVFLFVIVQTRLIKSRHIHQGMNTPKILQTVSRDAKIYFAIITTSHFLIVIMNTTTGVRLFASVPEFDAY